MTTTTETALTLPQRAAVALASTETELHLRGLLATAKEFVTITNKAGREDCHSRYMALKKARVAVETAGKTAREDATAFSKAVIAEEKRLVAIVADEEARLQELRDEWDAEQERIKAEAAERERQRLTGIQMKLAAIVSKVNHATPIDSTEIQQRIQALSAVTISLDEYQEFTGEAQAAKDAALVTLADMLSARLEYEAEQKRLAEEAEARRKQEEAERVQREAREAEERRLLAEQRAEIARQQAIIAENQRRMEEEQARIAAEQAAREAELKRREEELQKERAAALEQLKREQEAQRRAAEELEAKAAAAPEPTSPPAQVDLSDVVAGGEPSYMASVPVGVIVDRAQLTPAEATRRAVADAVAIAISEGCDCNQVADAAIQAMPLYAAAPQMLEALKELIAAGDNCCNPNNGDDVAAMLRFAAAHDAACAAIAAATGEEVAG